MTNAPAIDGSVSTLKTTFVFGFFECPLIASRFCQ